jgi:hypothetical protein
MGGGLIYYSELAAALIAGEGNYIVLDLCLTVFEGLD